MNEKIKTSAWITLITLSLFYMLSFIDRQILSMMVDPIKRDLQINDFQVSLLLGLAFALLYTFLGLIMGAIVDRYPRRLVVFLGVTFWSLATAACGLAGSFNQLFIARMAVGIGEATLTPAAYSILSDVFPRRRLSLAIAIFTLGSSIGITISLLGGGYLITSLSKAPQIILPVIGAVKPWQLIFIGFGCVGLLMASMIFIGPEPKRRGAQAMSISEVPTWHQALLWVMERRKLWLAVTMTFLPMALLATVVSAWTPTYMSRNFGWSSQQLGFALALAHAVPFGFGQLFNGLMVDRLFSKGIIDAHFRYFLITAIISSIAGIAAFLVSNPTIFLILLVIPSFLLFAGGGYAAAAIQMLTPNRLRGRIGGFYMVIITLPAFIIGPSLIALLASELFKSEKAFGSAIALTMAISLPVMIAGSFVGMRAMRQLVPVMLAKEAEEAKS